MTARPSRLSTRLWGDREKESFKVDGTSAGKVRTCTLLMTRKDEEQQAVAGINSLNSKIDRIVRFCATKRRGAGDLGRQQEEKCGKHQSSSVRPE